MYVFNAKGDLIVLRNFTASELTARSATFALPHATVVVRVLEFAERRGPFEAARLLYERLDSGGDDASLAGGAGGD